ncbi:hypothetical protein AAFP35_22565 [Gordonia sp. CPCC 206044]|uniref:Rv2732c family membrane protein n=1 Tax=Gordonia sp. CPCC 206044 TaxID=3140793 RepID=UPI003AF407F6
MSGTEFDELVRDLKGIERRVAREIVPGWRTVTVSASVAVLAALSLLPVMPGVSGWQLILHVADGELDRVSSIARGFAVLVLVTSVFSLLAIIVRRWGLALIALAGACLSAVFGLLGVWSQNTMPGYADATPTLILAWVVAASLIPQWVPLVWAHSALDTPSDDRRGRSS